MDEADEAIPDISANKESGNTQMDPEEEWNEIQEDGEDAPDPGQARALMMPTSS